ncbi:LacI family DNA-binding transcriptional regulator [Devosia sp. YIM 151766]|uniref:LacI family DNA-binding transcriptional regulator n=1 Tax=Devosia sp. YIM 151766 TaxID=3017325 RepID=UPI00255CEC52|nr:LacI family DNA-binding transcriptional regulator [Devosia sp. YIM 151766]WIY53096.1 LacI family DNA-binding transcriptional regulator [Devosia sp. YIM 151766]
MKEDNHRRRATVHDVARAAGVSLATVDRVLNGRPGVRAATAEKVEKAIAGLGFSRDLNASLMARARDLSVIFFIPDGANEFMDSLAEAVARRFGPALADRMHLETRRIKALDSAGLARSLAALDAQSCDCAVIVTGEEPRVIAAVEAAHRRGIAVMTLVSDLPGSARRNFIGIDNVAAGRTAASLLGRFLPQGGTVAVIAGSLHLRDHAERLEGFRTALAAEFPALSLVGPLEGHDEPSQTAGIVAGLLKAHPQLSGLYNLGAGNAGLVQALDASGRAGRLRVIAHELTAPTRAGLLSGAIDVVLDQNPDGEIREAIAAARSLALGNGRGAVTDPIEIGIFLRDNLR